MESIVARGVLARRDLSNGGIAGVVVGVCVAVALVALCLYPIILKRVRKRRKRPLNTPSDGDDPETGEVPAGGSPIDDTQRRLSSQDSFKPADELTRGGIEGGSVKDLAWNPHDGVAYSSEPTQLQQSYVPRLNTNIPPAQGQQVYDDSIPRSASLNTYEGEYMPQYIGDAHGVIDGTSADYYSPSIPSEAFGMYASNEPQQPQRTLSRGSSLRANLKQMFSRKNIHDQSMSSPASLSFHEAHEIALRSAPQGTQDAPLQRITTAQDPTESPVDIDPSTADMPPPPPPPPQALGSPIHLPSNQPLTSSEQSPPQSPPSAHSYKTSPSYPVHPAPGTVNPMDIMPASSEREMWHRTEHELFMVSSPNPQLPEQPRQDEPVDSPSPFTLPPDQPQALPVIQSPTPAQSEVPFKQELLEEHDTQMVDIPSHNHLSPLPEHYGRRHSSYPSDTSTPQPEQASTNPSTLNTPATQLDTPSPHSGAVSDYRHSASPSHHQSTVSLKNGTHPCNEPGCNQVFDQPHKLK